MTPTQLETAVAAWLNAVRGARELVKGRIGEAPAPAVPYIMYSVDVLELPDSIPTHDDGTTQTVRASAVPVEIALSIVGDLAAPATARNDAARLLLTLRMSQRTADVLAMAGLAGVGPVRNMSAVEVGTMRQRFDTRVTLSAILTAEAATETIGQVEIGVFEHTIPTSFQLQIAES